jgi:hypothetical protein
MERQDDRFDFRKFELPNVWLTFTKGGGGTFKSADGKMKLPPGHSLASKFPEKVATKAEMEERAAKAKGEKVAGGGSASVDPESLDKLGLSRLDRDAIDKALETGVFDNNAKLALANIDVDVFDGARRGIRLSGQEPRLWNQSLRDTTSILDEAKFELDTLRGLSARDRVEEAKFLKESLNKKFNPQIDNAKSLGQSVGALSKEQMVAASKSEVAPRAMRRDPEGYFRNAASFYQNEVPKIMQFQRDSLFREIDNIVAQAPVKPSRSPGSTGGKGKGKTKQTKADDFDNAALDELLGF